MRKRLGLDGRFSMGRVRSHGRWTLLLPLLAGLMGAPAPAAAQNGCPDVLLGDSLAVGMAPFAQAQGFQVIARGGAGITWLRQQEPRCARRLVLVFGTNDLRGMRNEEADSYLRQISAVMERWPAARIIWATPGCFNRDAQLEQGSTALDRMLARRVNQADDALRHLPAINRGREARCTYDSHDGVHPTAEWYRNWWTGLMRSMERTQVAGVR
ncbi:SGNH/GDSL hydrolase family protein [Roseomonas stagni]|uniref:SGNH/GDSL hydrolase family protein n=1 Tax=Falsiroseomonas algicola TaxID=2716930 RepID=A0A6M1LKY7_9PROT|nr:SGNH/GDSL hydrolase family protein [Falsiroseomonas algicola]NGM20981.1 SGNH/GDSL hydrolase family protein [Falsiroseomonas algicola]